MTAVTPEIQKCYEKATRKFHQPEFLNKIKERSDKNYQLFG